MPLGQRIALVALASTLLGLLATAETLTPNRGATVRTKTRLAAMHIQRDFPTAMPGLRNDHVLGLVGARRYPARSWLRTRAARSWQY